MATKALNIAKKLQILDEMELAPQNMGYFGVAKESQKAEKNHRR